MTRQKVSPQFVVDRSQLAQIAITLGANEAKMYNCLIFQGHVGPKRG